jgi:hypothetical protein
VTIALELDPDEIAAVGFLLRYHLATWGIDPGADFTLIVKGEEATVTGEDGEGKEIDFGIDYIRSLSDEKRTAESLRRQLNEAYQTQEHLQMTVNSGSALYDTIYRRLTPYFDADTRDLDWDVLPGTLEGLALERERLRVGLSACEERAAKTSSPATIPDCLITTADVATLLMVTTPELLRRHRDKDPRDEIAGLPTPLRGYWDRQAVEALSAKWCSKPGGMRAVIAGAGGGL